jgi:hypothetical protein
MGARWKIEDKSGWRIGEGDARKMTLTPFPKKNDSDPISYQH